MRRARSGTIAAIGGIAALAALAGLAPPRAAAEPATRRTADEPRPDVLLITLDTVRRDFLGCHGRTPSPTPALDLLAGQSMVFDDAYTVAPLTLPAHASLLTGLYPTRHGIHDNSLYSLAAPIPTLAEQLKSAGYATGAAVAAFVLDPVFGLEQGFDVYRAPPRGVSSNRSLHFTELPAAKMVDVALSDLSKLARAGERPPFFYWLHLYDCHAPYEPRSRPEIHASAALQRTAVLKALYEQELRETDAEIGRLFGELQRHGGLQRTIIVVTSDHGEGLGDGREETHGQFLFDPTMRVPLLWREPGVAPGRSAVPASLVDVMPTLLARCGVTGGGAAGAAAGSFDGLDLSPWLAEPGLAPPDRVLALESWYVWLNFGFAPFEGVAAGPLKYVRSAREELYDRNADPGETTNLFGSGEPRAQALRRRLEALQEAAQTGERVAPALSEADRAALAALGYAQGGSVADRPDVDWSTLPDAYDKTAVLAAFDELSTRIDAADWDGALKHLREWVVREPGCVLFREQLGMLLINLSPRNAAEAVTELQKTLELDPRRARVWFALARAFDAQAQDAKSRKEDARARQKGREAKRAAEEEKALLAKSAQACRECLRLEPTYPDALMFLCRARLLDAERAFATQEYAVAKPIYREVAELIERFFASVGTAGADDAAAGAVRELASRRLEEIGSAGR
ncbi:MAG: sulfatase [Planctomycetes bacterium]|nr:sulfatase [Planctomycetota bacterium]